MKPSKSVFSLTVKKNLEYLNPKGASKRVLPGRSRPLIITIPKKSNDSLTPTRLPPLKSRSRTHLTLVKSTRIIKNMNPISSRDTSPSKLESPNTVDSIQHLSGIIESCENLSKINKADILTAVSLKKNRGGLEKTDFFENNLQRTGNLPVNSSFHKPGQGSIDKYKRESFETTYFVEKTLNKNNSIKKLKEKIMPWKRISVVHKF
jgi:hypothetical protein